MYDLSESAEQLEDGSCRFTYRAQRAGVYTLAVRFGRDGAHIPGSPWHIPVESARAVARNSTAGGRGLQRAVGTAMNSFTIAARDGVDKITSLHPQDVRVYVSPSPPGMLHSVDAGPREGEIRVNYFVHVASAVDAAILAANDSTVELSVFFVARGDGVTEAETLEHIRGSPFSVPFVTSVSGAPALAIASAYVSAPFFCLPCSLSSPRCVAIRFDAMRCFVFDSSVSLFCFPIRLATKDCGTMLTPPPSLSLSLSLVSLPAIFCFSSAIFWVRYCSYGASFMGRTIPSRAASPPPATRAVDTPAALPSGIDSMLSSALAELATARASPLPVPAFLPPPTQASESPRRSPDGASRSSARRGTYFGTYAAADARTSPSAIPLPEDFVSTAMSGLPGASSTPTPSPSAGETAAGAPTGRFAQPQLGRGSNGRAARAVPPTAVKLPLTPSPTAAARRQQRQSSTRLSADRGGSARGSRSGSRGSSPSGSRSGSRSGSGSRSDFSSGRARSLSRSPSKSSAAAEQESHDGYLVGLGSVPSVLLGRLHGGQRPGAASPEAKHAEDASSAASGSSKVNAEPRGGNGNGNLGALSMGQRAHGARVRRRVVAQLVRSGYSAPAAARGLLAQVDATPGGNLTRVALLDVLALAGIALSRGDGRALCEVLDPTGSGSVRWHGLVRGSLGSPTNAAKAKTRQQHAQLAAHSKRSRSVVDVNKPGWNTSTQHVDHHAEDVAAATFDDDLRANRVSSPSAEVEAEGGGAEVDAVPAALRRRNRANVRVNRHGSITITSAAPAPAPLAAAAPDVARAAAAAAATTPASSPAPAVREAARVVAARSLLLRGTRAATVAEPAATLRSPMLRRRKGAESTAPSTLAWSRPSEVVVPAAAEWQGQSPLAPSRTAPGLPAVFGIAGAADSELPSLSQVRADMKALLMGSLGESAPSARSVGSSYLAR